VLVCDCIGVMVHLSKRRTHHGRPYGRNPESPKIKIYQSRWLCAKNLDLLAIPVLLLVLSIFILFLTRKYFLEVRKGEEFKKDKPPPETYLG
jgi:hypothetical protein